MTLIPECSRRLSCATDVVVEAAKQRVSGLEGVLAALAALGAVDGPEVQFLKECLQKARRAAQETTHHRPSEPDRSVRPVGQVHDAERQQLVQELTESESRLSRLQEVARAQEAPVITPPHEQPDMATQVQHLQQMVNRGGRGSILHRFVAHQEVSEVGSCTIHSLGHRRRRTFQPIQSCWWIVGEARNPGPPRILRGPSVHSKQVRDFVF